MAGKLSATPGRVQHAGPKLGSSNRAILIDELGFTEEELGSDLTHGERDSSECGMLNLPDAVTVVDVSARDGLQSFHRWVDTDVKVAMVDRLSRSAFP